MDILAGMLRRILCGFFLPVGLGCGTALPISEGGADTGGEVRTDAVTVFPDLTFEDTPMPQDVLVLPDTTDSGGPDTPMESARDVAAEPFVDVMGETLSRTDGMLSRDGGPDVLADTTMVGMDVIDVTAADTLRSDSSDAASDGRYVYPDGARSCLLSSECDDGNPTTFDWCYLLTFTSGYCRSMSCDDGQVCTIDSVSPTGCVHMPAADTTFCRTPSGMVRNCYMGTCDDCGNYAQQCCPVVPYCRTPLWPCRRWADGVYRCGGS